jgi:pimeloyl-ACP methyl ester carboxylesterase
VRRGRPTLALRTIHGYRRAFLMGGGGPALLLVDGIGDSSETWRPVIEELARDHTVIAPDLLGHGRSDKPRADYSVAAYANGMRDLLSVLEVERVTVVGHALGRGVAAQFAYQFPERCERLVLVGSGGVGRSVSVLLRLAAVPGIGLLMTFLGLPPARLASRVTGELLRRLGTPLGRDVEEVLRVFDALPDGEARHAILRTLRSGVDWRGQAITMLDRAYLAEGLPTLLVWGLPRRHHPGGTCAPGPRGHPRQPARDLRRGRALPPPPGPERFVALVRDFVGSTEPPGFDPGPWRDRLRRGRRFPEAEVSTWAGAFLDVPVSSAN